MKKLLLIPFILISHCLFAQYEGKEVGFRGGLTSGITYRQYLEENLSYEGLLSFRQDGMQFTFLRQTHEKSFTEISENLYLVLGYGAHAGFFYASEYKLFLFSKIIYPGRKFSPVAGLDGYAGIEYRFNSIPFTVSLDYKPFFEISPYQFFKISIWDMAFGVKYRF
jgi:hypothetical protein